MEFNAQSVFKRYLMPYQLRWVNDTSRFKIGLWSRQTGKSFATAAEAVQDCLAHEGIHWVVLSAGERQALEWMEKAKLWVKVFKKVVEFAEPEYVELINAADATQSKTEVRFANGSRITAIPANPDTARGYSANLILDEFAIHEKPFDIWAAIIPSINSPHGGEKKVRIVSTPKGRGNKFADLWEHNDLYSKHKETIEDAVREGLKVDIDQMKAAVDDDDIWAQEFMCQFIDNSSVLLPYEMIGKCESADIKSLTSGEDAASPLYIGMDVGRQKDLSVIITAAKCGDVLVVTGIDTLRKMPFADQLAILCDKARASRVRGVCIDSTGIGAMLAEEAVRKVGGKVQPVQFTVQSKGEMYGLMRRRFEERSIRIPVDRDLREDLHAVQRLVSTGGNVTYSAPRNADGHSDRAAALALCCLAAKSEGITKPVISSRRRSYENRSID